MKTSIYVLSLCLVFGAIGGPANAAEPNFQRETIDSQIEIGYGLAIGRVDADDKADLLLADKNEIVWYKNPGEAGKKWEKFVIARNLTERDHVCLAARDITGDGLVEVAVGANWNPGETIDASQSGNLFYLQRPEDPRKPWQPVPITPHEPTTHRMHWIEAEPNQFLLAVLPLHGVDNKGGEGKTVNISLFKIVDGMPEFVRKVDTAMHMTHNFDVLQHPEVPANEFMFVAGKEGYLVLTTDGMQFPLVDQNAANGAGEVRGYQPQDRSFVGIEPMHGTDLTIYRSEGGPWNKEVIDTSFNQGHALAAADLFGSDTPEIVAGWRNPNANDKVGIKVYSRDGDSWTSHWVDENEMATEDLKLHDFNGDGKLDIVAAGRATKNVVIYWNQSG